MSAILGSVDATRGPPTAVPLRHVVVALAFLVAGVLVGAADAAGAVPGVAHLAHVHLLFVGWIAITILGAMTQFVPVWAGTTLYSRRLANLQLVLVGGGVATFAVAFATTSWWLLLAGALAMWLGFLAFAYNLARTLLTVDDPGTTEGHFAVALVAFVLLSTLGVLMAGNYATGVLAALGVDQAAARGAHVALAVFGAILTTVYGALYQLAPMFTQSDLDALDHRCRRVESVAHPVGVLALAAGRFADAVVVARIGGVLVVLGAFTFAVVFARRLWHARVEPGALQRRYAVAALALAAWAAASAPAWLSDPTAPDALLGAPDVGPLLLVAAVGFVVAGTSYHVVPFLVWVERYSDRLGYEPVPSIDDLYDARVARSELALVVVALLGALAASVLTVPDALVALAGTLAAVGVLAFAGNLVGVVHHHAARGVHAVVLGALAPRRTRGEVDTDR
ncbi:hypothetical protein [Halorubellus litoreus]|uniref:Uncharacterized protein n=1 Tax=Halorubellus litoreus TaxID=755308 RepID=A0ABD5VKB8_9EURY